VAFVPETGTAVTPARLERLARQRRLELLQFTGSLDQLVRLDTPALLELRGEKPGRSRLVALTGLRGGHAALAPASAMGASRTLPELKRLWTGRAYLLWKNYQDIPPHQGKGAGAVAVIRLQLLLAGTGHFSGEPTGLFDDQTRAALRAFQSTAGLKADGALNARTLLLLYRRSGKYIVPQLGAGERGHS
jgi:general secretion pathway protein A